MGFFDAFKKNKESAPNAVPMGSAKQPTDAPQSIQKVNLTKSKADLRTAIQLTKEKSGVDIATVKARVAVVMDKSGSMSSLYENGEVQSILTRLLPFALQFDDNGELDVYVFSNNCNRVKVPMTEDNYETYVRDHILGKFSYGGTEYAPAVEKTDDDYNDKASKMMPSLVFFITDGENSDEKATNRAIIKSSKHGVFYQFIGIGNSSFKYLEALDNLDGRTCDNTGFMTVKDFEKADNVQVFTESLTDYVPWLKSKGYII